MSDSPASADAVMYPPIPPPIDLDWKDKQLVIGCPWYRELHPATAFSIMGLLDRAKMQLLLNYNDAYIAHSRNSIASRFLKTEIPWLLMVDSDMVLPIGKARWFNDVTNLALPEKFAGMHTITRLMSHGKTLVGAVYSGRHQNGKTMYAEAMNDSREAIYARVPRDICKPTRWVATGCILIHRNVFLDISKKYPKIDGHWFSPSENDLTEAVRQATEVLGKDSIDAAVRVTQAIKLLKDGTAIADHNSRLGTGEDVIFNIRAAAAGHQPHVDLGCVCAHIGARFWAPSNVGS